MKHPLSKVADAADVLYMYDQLLRALESRVEADKGAVLDRLLVSQGYKLLNRLPGTEIPTYPSWETPPKGL